jgi:Acetyltransferase (GNAT) domain
MDARTNKEKYKDLCKSHGLSIFYQPWWLDVVAGPENWDVLLETDKSGEINAAWPFELKQRKGLRTLENPVLSPYLGIWLKYPKQLTSTRKIDFEERSVAAIQGQLPKHAYLQCSFDPSFTNWQPFYWLGYEQTTHYTYILEQQLSRESIWNNFKSSLRNHIKKGNEELVVSTSDDIDQLYTLVQSTFGKQNRAIPYSLATLRALFEAATARNQCRLWLATDDQNVVVAGALVVYDEKTVYNLITGSDKSRVHSSAIPLLLWEGIQFALDMGLDYNFEGSMLQKVNELYSSFGGKQVPYFVIHRSKNKWIETARIWLRKKM